MVERSRTAGTLFSEARSGPVWQPMQMRLQVLEYLLERPGETRPSAAVGRPFRNVRVLEPNRPGAREVEAGHDVDERRLAGAVRADQSDDLAPAQLERDLTESPDAFI